MDESKRSLYKTIIADRKPYFMKYIYPALSRQYNEYVKSADKNSLREFGMTVAEMSELPAAGLTTDQLQFIQKYRRYMPVGTHDCVMNIICHKIESIFKQYRHSIGNIGFDHSVLKSGSDYSESHMNSVRKIMIEYNKRIKSYMVEAGCNRVDDDAKKAAAAMTDEWFMEMCSVVCPDADELCDIVIDLCYAAERTKQFAWRMCGEQIVKNLTRKNGAIYYPEKDEEGEIQWKSSLFGVSSTRLDVVE